MFDEIQGCIKKIKDVIDKYGVKFDDLLRGTFSNDYIAEECFDELREKNVDICFIKNGKKISTEEELINAEIDFPSSTEYNIEYCIKHLEPEGIVRCDKLSDYEHGEL